MKSDIVTSRLLFYYGFIALPVAFAGFPLYVLAPDFYMTHHGLSLTLIGTLLLFIRFFDAVLDLLIGWMVDRFNKYSLFFMSVSGFVLCLAIFGIFNLNIFDSAVWFVFCMIFAVSSYSVLTVLLGAQATLWTQDQSSQTRIAGVRESFGLIGLLVAASMPELLSRVVVMDSVYFWYSAILFGLMAFGVVIFSKLPKFVSLQKISSPSFFDGFSTFSAESYRFFAVYGVSMFAASVPAVLVIFYVRDLLQAESLIGVFLFLYFFSGVVSVPFWKKISVRLGKYEAWFVANLFVVCGFIGAFFLNSGDVWAYAAICMVSGFSLGADLILPPSILSDQIHECGRSAHSGTYYAFLTFVAKIALALASIMVLPMLEMAGFKPKIDNSQQALMMLSVTYAFIPSILKLMAAGLLYKFFIRSS